MDNIGAVVANTVYVKNALLAKNAEVTLPEATPGTFEINAMGPTDIPNWSQIESMETTIKRVGADYGLYKALIPDMMDFEVRFVQKKVSAAGKVTDVSCKAFIKGIPANIPEISSNPGDSVEAELKISTLRYRLIAEGKEVFLVDKIAGVLKIGGKNYSSNIEKYL